MGRFKFEEERSPIPPENKPERVETNDTRRREGPPQDIQDDSDQSDIDDDKDKKDKKVRTRVLSDDELKKEGTLTPEEWRLKRRLKQRATPEGVAAERLENAQEERSAVQLAADIERGSGLVSKSILDAAKQRLEELRSEQKVARQERRRRKKEKSARHAANKRRKAEENRSRAKQMGAGTKKG